MGTPDYLAPEQARNAHQADIRADIYSLGCTLYCLLTGQVPFPGGTVIDKVLAHAERRPQRASELRKGLPPALARVLDRMLAKDPAQRYPTPQQVADALTPFAVGRRPRRRRWIGALLAGAAVLLAGIVYLATDNGQIQINSKVDDVQIVVTRGGQEYEVIDLKSGSTLKRLRSGDYLLRLKGDRTDVKLSKDGFTLTRGGQVIVEVNRVDGPAVAVEPLGVQGIASGAVGQPPSVGGKRWSRARPRCTRR